MEEAPNILVSSFPKDIVKAVPNINKSVERVILDMLLAEPATKVVQETVVRCGKLLQAVCRLSKDSAETEHAGACENLLALADTKAQLLATFKEIPEEDPVKTLSWAGTSTKAVLSLQARFKAGQDHSAKTDVMKEILEDVKKFQDQVSLAVGMAIEQHWKAEIEKLQVHVEKFEEWRKGLSATSTWAEVRKASAPFLWRALPVHSRLQSLSWRRTHQSSKVKLSE